MVYKCLLLILTALCGTFIGMEYRHRLAVRVESLEMLRSVFKDVRSYVMHSGMPLNEIIEMLAVRYPELRVISTLSENIQDRLFCEAMQETLTLQSRVLCLTPEDCRAIVGFSERLGRFDTDTELETLEMIDERLRQMIDGARTSLQSDGKIYTALGSSCGIIVGLLVI